MDKRLIQSLRLRQIETQFSSQSSIQSLERPAAGWLRAIRQALGLSLKAVADRLGKTPSAVKQAEDFEAIGSITLRRLEAAAEAMGCRLVYAIVPRSGSLSALAHADENDAIHSIQRTMALEGQSVENPGDLA